MAKTAMDLVAKAKSMITEIDVDQAEMMLKSGSIALDVRDESEYKAGHIPKARHITRGMLEFKIANHPDFEDKSRTVIVYCKSGGRSALATATLQQLGFTDIYSMVGGFDNWQANNKPVSYD